MPTIISGDGTITGLTSTGISAVQKLPAGAIIQVVGANNTMSNTTITATSPTSLGLTATITPKFSTSKILVLVNQNGVGKDGAATFEKINLLRSSTVLATMVSQGGQTNSTAVNYQYSSSICYLDSPATTSATTYKTQISNVQATGAVYAQIGSAVSTITLMEIAG